MLWPTPQDYREAIQNPRLCFRDPELQSGRPELDKLGLPRPITGGFASVYKIKCGTREWAVRCFTNAVKDQKVRYDAISQHLSSVHLPYLVPFEYLSEGINMNGHWFPVVKMLWVEGESLLPYIQRNLQNVEILKELAEKWQTMISELQAAGIAHGDLQHGNILICNDELILIDYDGMYVPSLNGMKSHELGHRNYQHPGRTQEHFGPYMDNFSVWVILLSLLAVSADASLWDSLGAGEGDENLLFRQKDFASPGTSRAFERLALVDEESLRSLVNAFREHTATEVPAIPLPPDRKSPLDALSSPAASVSAASVMKWISHLAAFADRLYRKNRLVAVRSQPETPYPAGSQWVLDYLPTEAIPSEPPTDSFILERTVSFLVLTAAASAVTVMFGYAPVTAVVSCMTMGLGVEAIFLSWRYRKRPTVQEKRTTAEKIKELEHAFADLTCEWNKIYEGKIKFHQTEEGKINDILRMQREVSEREKQETEEADRELQVHEHETARARQTIDQEEVTELAGVLAAFQKTWLEEQLMKIKISKEKITDVDDEVKRRLRTSGIRTAADFLDIHIFQSYGRKKVEKVYVVLKDGGSVHVGMTSSQAKALIAWKRKLERQYRAKIPSSLPRSQITAIQAKYKDRKSVLDRIELTYKTRTQQKISSIRQTYSPEHAALKREEDTARINLNTELHRFDKETAELNKRLAGNQWELHHRSKRMDALKDVTFFSFLRKVFWFR